MDEKTTNSSLKSGKEEVKFSADVKDTSIIRLPKYTQLPLNTDIKKLGLSKQLLEAADSFGVKNAMISPADGFYSFEIAHKFPEYIGQQVDVVSDAENVKNLLKMPFCKDSVSMMVHRFGNTLLIDNFDVHEKLFWPVNEGKWDWLREFFCNNISNSMARKEDCYTYRQNTTSRIHNKICYSKFLCHSIDTSSYFNNVSRSPNQVVSSNQCSSLCVQGPTLPEPSVKDKYVDRFEDRRVFNQNVLWDFNNFKMLLGSDVPIFDGGTYSRLTLKLSDFSKPLNVLTKMNYWLDNLICDVPEVLICHHNDAIIKKYTLVNTEDLPYFDKPEFSTAVIANFTENILEFLKSNTPEVGHSYWLFKGKNNNEVKLYDLTLYCQRKEDLYLKPSPFSIPVVMLMYCVAYNLLYYPNGKNVSNSRTILKKCLRMLNKTNYPHLVASVYYMLSDLHLTSEFDPLNHSLDKLINVDCDSEVVLSSGNEQYTYSVDINSLLSLPTKNNGTIKPKNSKSKPINLTLEGHCQKAFRCVAYGTEYLRSFKFTSKQNTNEVTASDKPTMDVPCPSSVLGTGCTGKIDQKLKNDETIVGKDVSNKNRKKRKNVPNQPFARHYPINSQDVISWKNHLKELFNQKACLIFITLAELYVKNTEESVEKYAKAFKYYYYVVDCHPHIEKNPHGLYSLILKQCGSICLLVCSGNQYSNMVKVLKNELEIEDMCVLDTIKALQNEDECTSKDCINLCGTGSIKNRILKVFEEKDITFSMALMYFEYSLRYESKVPEKNTVNTLIGNVYSAMVQWLTNRTIVLEKNRTLTLSEFVELYETYEVYFSKAISHYKSANNQQCLAETYFSRARILQNIGFKLPKSLNPVEYALRITDYCDMAVENYEISLKILGSSREFSGRWNKIYKALSSIVFLKALFMDQNSQFVEDKAGYEKKVIGGYLTCFNYLDKELDIGLSLATQKFQRGFIHFRLGILYHNRLSNLRENIQKFKTTLGQCCNHYNTALQVFIENGFPFDSLDVVQKQIEIEELQYESSSNLQYKVKFVIAMVEALDKLIVPFQMILNRNVNRFYIVYSGDTVFYEEVDFNNEDEFNTYVKKEQLPVKNKILKIMKTAVQLSSTKGCKLTNKKDQLKTIFAKTLRANEDVKSLLQCITEILELKL